VPIDLVVLTTFALCFTLAAGDPAASVQRKQLEEVASLEDRLTDGGSLEEYLSAQQATVDGAEKVVPPADPLRALSDEALAQQEPLPPVTNEIARRAARAKQELAQANVELIKVGYAQLDDGKLTAIERRDMANAKKRIAKLKARADKIASLEKSIAERAAAPKAAPKVAAKVPDARDDDGARGQDALAPTEKADGTGDAKEPKILEPKEPAVEPKAPDAKMPSAADASTPKIPEDVGPRGATSGLVMYVTAKEAYLDVGRELGVPAGGQLKVFRRDKQVGVCDVVELAAWGARCRAGRLRPGDRVAFVPTPRPALEAGPAAEAKKRAPLPGPTQLAAWRKIVEAAPVTKVPFHKVGGDLGLRARGTTTLRQEVWGISTTPGSVFARSSVDASAHAGMAGFPHAFTSASLRVVGDVIAPPEQRFRPGELVELYVWNASLGVDDGPVVGELGRFRPRKAPGALLIDGAQIGARLFDASTEIGAYAGAVPNLLSLAPTLDVLTAGAYFGLDLKAADGVLVLPRARAALLSTGDFGVVRGEVEAQAQLFWANVFSVGGSVRAGMGGTGEVEPSIDGARIDGDVAIIEPLKLSAGYRYLAAPAVDFDLLAAVLPVGGAHHGSASTAYTVAPWLVLGATAGVGHDLVLEVTRGYAGPEVGLPQAFGALGGLDIGYLEELGHWPGRSAWLSAHLTPLAVLRILTRVSYFETEALGDSLREGGLMTMVDAPLLPWLSVRGRGYVQQGMPSATGEARAVPTVFMADLALSGSL
jgi:hypothetical protein